MFHHPTPAYRVGEFAPYLSVNVIKRKPPGPEMLPEYYGRIYDKPLTFNRVGSISSRVFLARITRVGDGHIRRVVSKVVDKTGDKLHWETIINVV